MGRGCDSQDDAQDIHQPILPSQDDVRQTGRLPVRIVPEVVSLFGRVMGIKRALSQFQIHG